MTAERRLIDDASVGSAHRALLRAGREASPTAMSKQQLLALLLPKLADTAPGQGTFQAKSGGALQAAQGTGLWKAATLGALSVVAGSAFYLSSTSDADRTAVLVSTPEAPVEHPVAPRRVESPTQPTAPEPQGQVPSPQGHAGVAASEAPPSHAVRPASAGHDGGRRRAPAHAVRPSKAHVAAPSRAPAVAAPLGSMAPGSAVGPLTNAGHTAEPSPGSATASPSNELPRDVVASGAAGSPGQPAIAPLQLKTQLAEELRQLDAVRQAVQALDEPTARRLLASYWKTFPEGHLAPEARRLRARIARLAIGELR